MKKTYIVSLLCFLSVTDIAAQHKEYKGEMSITPLQLEQKGDSLYINIDFDMRDVSVDSRRSISLIPVLVSTSTELILPEVMVKGRANYLISSRELALMSKTERQLYNENPPYAILKGYKSDEQKQILYNKVIRFEPWMKDALLEIRKDLCGCGNPARSLEASTLSQVQLEPIVAPYIVTPHLAYVQPIAEAIKKREMVSEAFLDFVVSQIDIRPDYLNNPRELKKITDMMQEIEHDSTVTVKGISVIGYASPEGTLKFNRYLSEGRATTLVNYLLPKFNYPQNMYRVEFGGENWKGLLNEIENSNITYKEDILSILNNKAITDETRKAQLKQFKNGEVYRHMLKDYFPYLRKAICKVDYEVRGFNVAEAKEIIKSRPQNLSLNEMYLVANTYEPGSEEFTNVFETAVKMFPNDETANLNAAVAALARKDTFSAEHYLVKVTTQSAEYNNTMGILMLLKEEYAQAESYLEKAIRSGLEIAKQNLDELHKKTANIKQIK